MHWYENVDRELTSVWKSRNPYAPATRLEAPLETHFFVDLKSLLLVTQIIKGKQLYYKI
jgi:hypothetical protein